jgi:hypothetical protein
MRITPHVHHMDAAGFSSLPLLALLKNEAVFNSTAACRHAHNVRTPFAQAVLVVLCCCCVLQGLPSLALWPRSARTCGPVLPALPTASSKQQRTQVGHSAAALP